MMARGALAGVCVFFASMAGRIFVLLTIGMVAAAIASLLVAEQARKRDFERLRLERVAASVSDIAARLRETPSETERMLAERQIIGARNAPDHVALSASDPVLGALLTRSLGNAARPEAGQVPGGLCFPQHRFEAGRAAAGIANGPTPDCWIVRFVDSVGVQRALAIDLPPLIIPPSSTLNPLFLLIIVAASGLLSILVARFAAAPLRRLAQAADAFSVSLDPAPVPERGPVEVRAALGTFNLMQQRVREGFHERTQVLAAISHDLQTPLTRLRLRLEQVEHEPLRERLVADLSATQRLVREGLDLARSSENSEPSSLVDIDSLLASIAEDAAEFGAPVEFVSGCGGNLRVKPDALGRCLTNLIDNAVKYGGSAEIRCVRHDGQVTISIRDRGAGLASEQLERMFDPFVRGEASRSRATGGTGIGLTIARAQARTFGGTVDLKNHPEGGLIAEIAVSEDHV